MARFAEAAAELTLVIVLLAVVVARKQKENTAQFDAIVTPLWPQIEKALNMQSVEKDSWSYRSLKRDFDAKVLDGLRPKSNQLDGTTQAAVEDVVKVFIAKWEGPISETEYDIIVKGAFEDFVKQEDGDTLAGKLRSSLKQIFESEALRLYQERKKPITFFHAIQSNVIDPLNERMIGWDTEGNKAFNDQFPSPDQKGLFKHFYLSTVRELIENSKDIHSLNTIEREALHKVTIMKNQLENEVFKVSGKNVVYQPGRELKQFYKNALDIYSESSKQNPGQPAKMHVKDLAKEAWSRVETETATD